MGKQPSLISINGNHYDANTGSLLGHPRGPVIDGFMRRPRAGQIINNFTHSITPHSLSLDSAKGRLRKPANTVHRRAQRSKTLMRGVVAKPSADKANEEKEKQSSKFGLMRGSSPSRLTRALNMTKSSKVQRFGHTASHKRQTSHSNSGQSPSSKNAAVAALAVAPATSLVRNVSHQRLERMLDEALLKADAHKRLLKGQGVGKRRFNRRPAWMPKWVAISVIALVVAGLGTYFAWQNVPSLSTKLASVRAHIQGSVPAYVPSGFKFAGPTKYESGAISMTYRANGEQYFTLEQKASAWDSASLQANAIPKDAEIQMSQVKGSTVYNFGDTTMWVSNGCINKIRHSGLSHDELSKIAGSILPNCG